MHSYESRWPEGYEISDFRFLTALFGRFAWFRKWHGGLWWYSPLTETWWYMVPKKPSKIGVVEDYR
jgi:hypothetical protein